MVKLASDAPIVKPPVRHGTCRLQITIGGTSYSLRPIPCAAARRHRLGAPRSRRPRAGTRYSVASVNREAGCTCPDHETNGATCKHVMALRAIGLIPRSARTAREASAEERPAPPAAPPRPSPTWPSASTPPRRSPPAPDPPAGRDPLARAAACTASHGQRNQPQPTPPAPAPGLHATSPTASGPQSAPRRRTASPAPPTLAQIGGAP